MSGTAQRHAPKSNRRTRLYRAAAAVATVTGLALLPSAAGATPGSGVTGTILAKGTSEDTLRIKAKGRTDVTVRTITIAPGGSTGWHYHPGQVLAVVQSGTLTRTLGDCTVESTPAGGSFVEPGGSKDIHIGRNLGTTPVVLYVTYLLPEGSPLSLDAPDPGC
ncbi:cupin domain-containing protein [Streptomyces sp. TRM66268-LWL]|uniref:Cupin domain-containing protein n=1 Tax=Streptomyces polyasparticus TaxID=2767826 RepID=A0ABR7SR48_9ACTN|nr:cupin domain-containing protein [Streptomyces polyasparticus]MBC9717057.1 cupin domain-containing protein [Streptomyces polyasparticus]